jgi:vitamin B12 transporter
MYALVLFAAAAGSEPLEPVVVTATRTEIPLRDTLASVELIAGDDLIMRPAADLGDALRFVPGVEVTRLGGPGQQTSVFVRGTESNHVLVLMDGLRINPGTIGTAATQNIAPEFVERVEVVKGPRSTLYGSDAIGGVINIITRDAEDGSSVQAGYGSYDTASASFRAGYAGDNAGLSIGGAWQDSEGFPTRSDDASDRGFENTSFTASASTGAGPVKLGLRAWYAEGTAQYSDFFALPVDQDFENSTIALTAEFDPTAAWRSRLMLGYAVDDLEQIQSTDFLDTDRYTVDWQNDITLPGQSTLTAGVLWQDEDAEAISFGAPYGGDNATTQIYVQDQVSAGAHRFVLGAAYTDHETFGGHATGNIEYGYAFDAGRLLSISVGSGFRAPDATDLYGFGGNTDLDPEESVSGEISWRQSIGERQSYSLTAFRTDIDDLIDFFIIDPDTFEGENRNIDEARIEGFEAAWHYDDEDWSARVTATWQDPRDETTDERLLRRARESYTAALARRFGAHKVALDVLYAGERRDFGFPQAVLPSYWLANLSARIALGERLSVLARVENLLDEDYALASGADIAGQRFYYNAPGQSFYGAIRYEFR